MYFKAIIMLNWHTFLLPYSIYGFTTAVFLLHRVAKSNINWSLELNLFTYLFYTKLFYLFQKYIKNTISIINGLYSRVVKKNISV